MDDRRCEVRGCQAAVEVVHLGSPLCADHWAKRAAAEQRPAPARSEAIDDPAGDAGTMEETMTPKQKSAKTTAPKKSAPKTRAATTRKPPKPTSAQGASDSGRDAAKALPPFPEPLMASGDIMTFAVRLTQAESAAIHSAAGPGGATRFARAALSAAARGDMDLLAQVVEVVKARAASR
jgi:hypothetical protein